MRELTIHPRRDGDRTALRVGVAVALGVPLLAAACAHADDIATDRPDFVESSDVVGKGVFQIETSFAYGSDRNDGVRTRVRSTPTLLRYGISDVVELRAETDGYLHERVREGGVTDAERGVVEHQRREPGGGLDRRVGRAGAGRGRRTAPAVRAAARQGRDLPVGNQGRHRGGGSAAEPIL